MSDSDSLYGNSISIDSVKTIGESIGVGNLPDEGAKELADEITYRLKHIIQVRVIICIRYCRSRPRLNGFEKL